MLLRDWKREKDEKLGKEGFGIDNKTRQPIGINSQDSVPMFFRENMLRNQLNEYYIVFLYESSIFNASEKFCDISGLHMIQIFANALSLL